MEIKEIKKFSDFIEKIISVHDCGHWVYRGVPNINYSLIPSIGRIERITKYPDDFYNYEREMLSQFKSRSRSKVNFEPKDDLEWLAVAQHHGLPTRLLDWSTSPLVAAFFATKPEFDSKGNINNCCNEGIAIYAVHFCNYINIHKEPNPFKLKNIKSGFFYPPHISERISGQLGLFSIQNDPTKNFELSDDIGEEIIKYTFKSSVANEMQRALYFLGIRQSMLFPDLDGFALDEKISQQIGECHFPGVSNLNNW